MLRSVIFLVGISLPLGLYADDTGNSAQKNTVITSGNTVVARNGLSVPAPKAAQSTYLIQPGDLLQISVWKEPDLQNQALVRPDGKISMPLAGDLPTKNKTVEQVRAELKTRLEKFIPDIDVTVSIAQLSGNKVYVIGQVNHPGEYLMNRPTDVMQALSMAAGTTKFADLGDIRILRRSDDDVQEVFRFDYNDVQRGRNLGQNIVLRGGDVIVVP